ncbi:bifunctional 5-dehydro-2-deoxygluconokinase/5-dehydro-2-deoxyphosphogluconate aldolase [Microbulbifer sp.]|uniref:bifunctional 5-dehydro-2-deoxygluconokinase/5-dehydro-2- deoxyphosphogluconate aldolase n=1 Tax=Microbulbifer sp. TaxID=1908541 RepID=UPI003F3CD379
MPADSKPLDLICMGRVAVDLYAQQIGADLEDAGSFAKYLGGSSGNVVYGTARQGIRSSMLARVGNEHMGRFVREELERAGVDTSHLITDPERLTALVILGIKDKDTFPLIFYRENCADMGITPADVDEDYIASARALAITGTHLSHPYTRSAVLRALEYAGTHGLKRILDIDYRPVLWGLTNPGDGETRYIESTAVTAQLQEVLHHFDLIVGTEEEFHIAGGSTDTLEALRAVREVSGATLVCKRGPLGCSVFEGQIPADLDEGISVLGVQVEVLNVLGAGDAFMSGLLRGYLNGESWEQSCRYANACGALVVSRHGCAPAMPSREELDDYLSRAESVPRPDLDARLNHLHRVTTRARRWDELNIIAFDHRSQLVALAQETGADKAVIPPLKKLIFKAAEQVIEEAGIRGRFGLFVDGTFGQDVLSAASGRGWWLARPIELPGSRPLRLEHGNIGSQLVSWPLDQIVKCLVFYHPEDGDELRLEQERELREIYRACCQSGHELLLEVILPADKSRDDELYLRALKRFYNLDIKPDWWKLPPLAAQSWDAVEALLKERDPHCRGVVILGLEAPVDQLQAGFNSAAGKPVVKGFAVGRTIFMEPSREWMLGNIDDDEFVRRIKNNYHQLIELWRQRGERK